MKASKKGRKVAVVDQRAQVGGACTFTATIPSKTLRHAITRLVEMRDVPGFRTTQGAQPSFGDLCRTARSVMSNVLDFLRNSPHALVGNHDLELL